MIPFLNITELTETEIDKKINELTKRMGIAQRTNSKARPQLMVMMQTLMEERSMRLLKKQIDNNPKMQPGLVLTTDENNQPDKEEDDGLINIK